VLILYWGARRTVGSRSAYATPDAQIIGLVCSWDVSVSKRAGADASVVAVSVVVVIAFGTIGFGTIDFRRINLLWSLPLEQSALEQLTLEESTAVLWQIWSVSGKASAVLSTSS
jgi:hypothetical protein